MLENIPKLHWTQWSVCLGWWDPAHVCSILSLPLGWAPRVGTLFAMYLLELWAKRYLRNIDYEHRYNRHKKILVLYLINKCLLCTIHWKNQQVGGRQYNVAFTHVLLKWDQLYLPFKMFPIIFFLKGNCISSKLFTLPSFLLIQYLGYLYVQIVLIGCQAYGSLGN